MIRVNLEPAYILHRRPYRETSFLLEVFSRTHGRVGLVARGVRRAKRGRIAPLEPLHPLLMSWSQKGDLGAMHNAESVGAPTALGGEALVAALYMNELMLRLTTRHDPHPRLFDDYQRSLVELRESPDVAPALRRFEYSVLNESGYGLTLAHAADGTRIDPDIRYDYEIGRGAMPARADQSTGLLVSGATLLALAAGQLEGAERLGEARRLLRAALAPHIGDKPLQTPQLLRAFRRLNDKTGP